MADASARYQRKRRAQLSEEEKAIEREKLRLRMASLRQRRAVEAAAVPARRSERIAARREVVIGDPPAIDPPAHQLLAADSMLIDISEEVAGPSRFMFPIAEIDNSSGKILFDKI